MFKRFTNKKKDIEVFSNVANGKAFDIVDFPDPMFSEKMMGDGYGILPTDGKFYAPVSGEVSLVFPTGHAVGLTSSEGLEILIHIGVDTVELEGQGFKVHVVQGQSINQGDLMVEVDLDAIKKAGKPIETAVIFTSGESVELRRKGDNVRFDDKDIIELSA